MQKTGVVPHNLPMEGTRCDIDVARLVSRPPLLSLPTGYLIAFKRLLEDDYGTPLPWSDVEVEEMAWTLLRLGLALRGSVSQPNG